MRRGRRAAPRPRPRRHRARRSRGRSAASCCARTCSRRCAATRCSRPGTAGPSAVEWRFGEAVRACRSSSTSRRGRAVRFAGRLDRVDETPSGARVIDYKTGAGATERAASRTGSACSSRSTSSPCGRRGARPRDEDEPATITCLYRLVTRRGGFEDLELPQSDEASAQARLRDLVTQRCRARRRGPASRARTAAAATTATCGYACGVSEWAQGAQARARRAGSRSCACSRPRREGCRRCPERPVCDQDVRRRVTDDLGTTFLLEAGAGTGKTRVLVDRYVSCVLDAERGAGRRAHRGRHHVHGEGRRRAAPAHPRGVRTAGGGRGRRRRRARGGIQAALDALDDAPIGTIHGFAGRLLREFPVEARVDPAFEQLDALGSTSSARRLWEEWLTELAAGERDGDRRGRGSRASCAPACGSTTCGRSPSAPGGVFGERYDIEPRRRRLRRAGPRRSLERLARSRWTACASFCAVACGDPATEGCMRRHEPRRRVPRVLLDGRLPTSTSSWRRSTRSPVKTTAERRSAAARATGTSARGGKDELWERYREAVAEVLAARERLRRLPHQARRRRRRRVLALGRPRRSSALGRLDFTDLLGCLRDLLQRDPRGAARRCRRASATCWSTSSRTPTRCRRRSSSSSASARPDAPDWRDVVLEPGKLFVVGDPKQSIYRFRRADIAMYDEVKHLVAGQPGGHRGGRGHQSELPHHAGGGAVGQQRVRRRVRRGAGAGSPAGLPVGGALPPGGGGIARGGAPRRRPYGTAAGAAEAARRDEARAVAALLLAMHGDDAARWTVQDRATGRRRRGEAWRPPRWGDVALLFRATTGPRDATSRRSARPACRTGSTAARPTSRGARSTTPCCACAPSTTRATGRPCTARCTRRSSASATTSCSCSGPAGGRFDLFAGAAGDARGGRRGARDAARAARAPRRLRAARAGSPSSCAAPARPSSSRRPAPAARRPSPTSRSWSSARARSRGPEAEASAAFLAWAAEAGDAAGEQESQVDDDGRRRPPAHHPQGQGTRVPDRDPRRRRPRRRRWRRRAHRRPRGAAPGDPAQGGTAGRPGARPRAAARTRRSGSARSSWRRASVAGCSTWPPRAPATAWSSPASVTCATRTGPAAAVLLGPIADALPAPACSPRSTRTAACWCCRRACLRPWTTATGRRTSATWLGGRAEWRAAARRVARAGRQAGAGHQPERPRARRRGGPGRRAGRPGRPRAGARAGLGRPPRHGAVRPRRRVVRRGRPPTAVAARARTAGPRRRGRRAGARRAGGLRPFARRRGGRREPPAPSTASSRSARSSTAWSSAARSTSCIATAASGSSSTTRPTAPRSRRCSASATGRRGPPTRSPSRRPPAGIVREVCFVAARADGLVVSVPVDDELRAMARGEVGAAAAAGRALRPDELAAGDPGDA